MSGSPVMEVLGMKFPQMFLAEGEKTFQFQGDLPSLPVPPLQQTMDKYLDSVRPHLSPAAYQHTEKLVRDFQRGEGQVLHEKLCQHARDKRNWLELWWEKYAYLTFREPAAPLVNFGGPGPYIYDMWKPEVGTQLERGAIIAWLTLCFWRILRKEQFKVDRAGLREKRVWCMYQLHRMFSSCKTPGPTQDHLNDYFKTEAEGDTPHHITIQSHGRIYALDVLDSTGELLTPATIQQHLQYIVTDCEIKGQGLSVGALTAMQRERFYEEHSHLMSLHPDNAVSMETVKTAIFNLVLDDAQPQDIEQLTRESLLGNARNRWFDKSFSFLIFKNGTIGCNCDHAPHDAMVMVLCTFWTLTNIQNIHSAGNKDRIMMPLLLSSSPSPPEEVLFHVDQRIQRSVTTAQQDYLKLCSNMLINIRMYTGYGRTVLREHKVVPDTHVQLCLQLAYYRTHGKPAPTYETASTRKYWHGRTETVRSCSNEAIEWAKCMIDGKATMDEKLSLYKAATTKHNTLMAEAQDAMGCDRHLFGMQCVAMEEGTPLPQIYTDPAWKKSGGGGNYILSTSFVGYTEVFGGVAPMCKEGYGFFYSIMPKQCCFFISTWKSDEGSDSERLYKNMELSLDQANQLLQHAASSKL